MAAHTAPSSPPALDWRDLDWLRDQSALPLVVKGVLDPRDAALAVGRRRGRLVVSNHGGRQLDGAPASIDLLPEVVAAVAGRARC